MIKNLIIDLRDRDSGSTHDFTVTLPHRLNEVKNVKINHIMLPHNVTDENNTFVVNGTTITLTNGNYHIYELVPEIQDKLNGSAL